MSQYHSEQEIFETSQNELETSQDELDTSQDPIEIEPSQELVGFEKNGASGTESENSVTSNQPSSPEEFHGFTTPTKEMDKI